MHCVCVDLLAYFEALYKYTFTFTFVVYNVFYIYCVELYELFVSLIFLFCLIFLVSSCSEMYVWFALRAVVRAAPAAFLSCRLYSIFTFISLFYG